MPSLGTKISSQRDGRKQQQQSGVIIEHCRQEILRLDLTVKAQILEIRSCPGPLTLLNRLTQDVKTHLGAIDEKISEIESWAATNRDVEIAGTLQAEASKHRAAQRLNTTNLRQAQLTCIQRIEKDNKQQLLGPVDTEDGADGQQLRQRKTHSKANDAVANSTDVTDGLASLLQVMDGQVKQSQATLETLVSSSQTIGAIDDETHSTGAAIQSSGKLLSKYTRREFTDKILICLALFLFFGTAAYIFKKRFPFL